MHLVQITGYDLHLAGGWHEVSGRPRNDLFLEGVEIEPYCAVLEFSVHVLAFSVDLLRLDVSLCADSRLFDELRSVSQDGAGARTAGVICLRFHRVRECQVDKRRE